MQTKSCSTHQSPEIWSNAFRLVQREIFMCKQNHQKECAITSGPTLCSSDVVLRFNHFPLLPTRSILAKRTYTDWFGWWSDTFCSSWTCIAPLHLNALRPRVSKWGYSERSQLHGLPVLLFSQPKRLSASGLSGNIWNFFFLRSRADLSRNGPWELRHEIEICLEETASGSNRITRSWSETALLYIIITFGWRLSGYSTDAWAGSFSTVQAGCESAFWPLDDSTGQNTPGQGRQTALVARPNCIQYTHTHIGPGAIFD